MATKKAPEPKKPAPKAAAKPRPPPRAATSTRSSRRPRRTSRSSSREPDNDTKLRLYSLFKQASEGDVKGARPGMFDFVGGAKYDAWAKLKGMDAEMAKKKYVDLVKQLGG
jgi:acyl-CoA-binding protein